MPIITVEGPKINVDQKRQLVKKLTDALVEVLDKIPREAIIVLIRENPPENVGSGGNLLADRHKG